MKRLIADASLQHIPLVLSDTRMQQRDDVEALTVARRIAWLRFPISRDSFKAMLDELILPPADVRHPATASVAGITIGTEVSVLAATLEISVNTATELHGGLLCQELVARKLIDSNRSVPWSLRWRLRAWCSHSNPRL